MSAIVVKMKPSTTYVSYKQTINIYTMVKIKWTPENKRILREMFNAEKTDLEISEYFGAATYAIAKERSVLGLVYRKMPKGIKRKKRSKNRTLPIDTNFCAITYNKDGQNHFSVVDSCKDIFTITRKMMQTQNIKNLVVLQPKYLLTQGSMEAIDLTK